VQWKGLDWRTRVVLTCCDRARAVRSRWGIVRVCLREQLSTVRLLTDLAASTPRSTIPPVIAERCEEVLSSYCTALLSSTAVRNGLPLDRFAAITRPFFRYWTNNKHPQRWRVIMSANAPLCILPLEHPVFLASPLPCNDISATRQEMPQCHVY
jgi:hypothetical protein